VLVIGAGNEALVIEEGIEKGADLPPEILDESEEMRRFGAFIDQEVKSLIQRDISPGVAIEDGLVDFFKQSPELVDVSRLEVRHCEFGGEAFQRASDTDQFYELFRRKTGDNNRPVGKHLEQPFGD
jgi:hypothetical protein